jgi:hypothetical protein
MTIDPGIADALTTLDQANESRYVVLDESHLESFSADFIASRRTGHFF